jgi:hypothetical protein
MSRTFLVQLREHTQDTLLESFDDVCWRSESTLRTKQYLNETTLPRKLLKRRGDLPHAQPRFADQFSLRASL